MKVRVIWQWLAVVPVGFALSCTTPIAPPPSVSPSAPLSLTPVAIEALREEVEEADKAVRDAADYLERVCPTVPSTVPIDEEMCRQIKPYPDSPKGKLVTAEVRCNELVGRYNDAVAAPGAPQSERITLGITPNRKYGDTITCS